jgi:serpin B
MSLTEDIPFAKRDGFCALGLDFNGDGLRFVILLPQESNGLAALEKRLTTAMLVNSISIRDRQKVRLFMPRLKLEPRMLHLAEVLKGLGMTNAFDVPPGSANYDRMTVARDKGDLFLSKVFHKTFLNLDEQGVEAVAVTGDEIAYRHGLSAPQEPLEVKVNHPFILAIMHNRPGLASFWVM